MRLASGGAQRKTLLVSSTKKGAAGSPPAPSSPAAPTRRHPSPKTSVQVNYRTCRWPVKKTPLASQKNIWLRWLYQMPSSTERNGRTPPDADRQQMSSRRHTIGCPDATSATENIACCNAWLPTATRMFKKDDAVPPTAWHFGRIKRPVQSPIGLQRRTRRIKQERGCLGKTSCWKNSSCEEGKEPFLQRRAVAKRGEILDGPSGWYITIRKQWPHMLVDLWAKIGNLGLCGFLAGECPFCRWALGSILSVCDGCELYKSL